MKSEGSHPHDHHHHDSEHDHHAVLDPVCGMSLDPAKAAESVVHGGQRYHFCSAGCRNRFEEEPGKYAVEAEPEVAEETGAICCHGVVSAPPKVIPEAAGDTRRYTCPMHPEVIQIGPGSCPKCGMTLEPMDVTGDDDEAAKAEYQDMKRRFWFATFLSVPVLAIAMGDLLPGHPISSLMAPRLVTFVELVLATPVVLWAGWPLLVKGWQSVVYRSLNMFTLIALGVGVAWIYSMIAALFPGIFPPSFRDVDGRVDVYFEAAAIITALVLLGQVLELRARSQTSTAIKSLLELAPKTARRVREDGSDEEVPLDAVQPGDSLRVRPGEKVPVDGEVVEGTTTID